MLIGGIELEPTTGPGTPARLYWRAEVPGRHGPILVQLNAHMRWRGVFFEVISPSLEAGFSLRAYSRTTSIKDEWLAKQIREAVRRLGG